MTTLEAKLMKCRTFDSYNTHDVIAELPTLHHGNVHFFVPVVMVRVGGVVVDVIEEREKTSTVVVTGESCSSTLWPNVFTVLNETLEKL